MWYVFPDETAAAASPAGVSGDYVVARSQEEALTAAQEKCAPPRLALSAHLITELRRVS